MASWHDVRPAAWAALGTCVVHGMLGIALALVRPDHGASRLPRAVEMDVQESPAPPPDVVPPAPPPPPPRPVRLGPRPKAPAAAPPLRRTALAPATAIPPAFGVSMDSVVTGESPVVVPVGDTLMTADRAPRRPGTAAAAPPAPAAPSFAPVADEFLAEMPRTLVEVEADYPAEASRLGMTGTVSLRVGIDRRGIVRSVRIVRRTGFGMDEAASQVMWRFRFAPARTRDGTAVDCQITFEVKFVER